LARFRRGEFAETSPRIQRTDLVDGLLGGAAQSSRSLARPFPFLREAAMKPFAFVFAVCVMGFGMNAACAVDVGQKAPAFEATDDQGQLWKSSDHVGKGVLVVYFYPAALTGGCTKQACGFRDDMAALKGKGVEVVGISGDAVKNLQLFKEVHHLNFTLLADEKGEVAKAFGVPLAPGGVVKHKIDGKVELLKRGVTAARWTFVIDKEGKVVLKNTKVNAPNDSKAVIKAVESLKSA
jgi:peroxiredoxin Q/BCP